MIRSGHSELDTDTKEIVFPVFGGKDGSSVRGQELGPTMQTHHVLLEQLYSL